MFLSYSCVDVFWIFLGRAYFSRKYFRGVTPFKAIATLEANTLSFLVHLGWWYFLEKIQGVHPFQYVASLGAYACPVHSLGLYGFSLSGDILQDYSVELASRNYEPTLRITTLGLVFAYYVSYLYTFLRRGELYDEQILFFQSGGLFLC